MKLDGIAVRDKVPLQEPKVCQTLWLPKVNSYKHFRYTELKNAVRQ